MGGALLLVALAFLAHTAAAARDFNDIVKERLAAQKRAHAAKKWLPGIIVPKSEGVNDEERSKCVNCPAKFNWYYTRKHHCCKCGEIFCSTCCPKTAVRTCLNCKTHPLPYKDT